MLLIVGGAFAGGWFLGLALDDTDEKLADTRAELRESKRSETRLEERVGAAETEQAALEEKVTKLTGEESGATTPALEGVRTVRKGKTLKLEEMEVSLSSFGISDTVSDSYETRRADGKFLTAAVTVKSRLDSGQTLDPDDHFALQIGEAQFTPDFDAMNYAGGENSWVRLSDEPLQPGTARTGTVIFDISSEAASKAASGTLLVLQFSDAGSGEEAPSLDVAGLKLR